MSKAKNLIKAVLFIFLIFLIYRGVNFALRDKTECMNIAGFNDEKKNSIDVVFIGSSQVVRSVMPMKIWNDTGITSYNMATSATTIPQMYYIAKMAVKEQHPKVIVADMSFINYNEKIMGTERFHPVFDNFDFSSVKYEAIFDLVDRKDWMEMIFPLYIYHSGWNQINQERLSPLKDEHQQKGAAIANTSNVWSSTFHNELTDDCYDIPDVALEYTEKLISLCKENNIELIMMNIPLVSYTPDYVPGYSGYLNSLEKLARDNNIVYYNGYRSEDLWGLDYYTDFMDIAHTNVRGADKITQKMEEFLLPYNLTDHRNDPKYSSWNDNYLTFKNYLDELYVYSDYEIGSIIDFKGEGNSAQYFVTGLTGQEATHRWSNGKEADAFFFISGAVDDSLTLEINAYSVFSTDGSPQQLAVYFNDNYVGEASFSFDNLSNSFEIPKEYINISQANHLSLRFTSATTDCDYINPEISIALDNLRIY